MFCHVFLIHRSDAINIELVRPFDSIIAAEDGDANCAHSLTEHLNLILLDLAGIRKHETVEWNLRVKDEWENL